jgi:hypothetical protein
MSACFRPGRGGEGLQLAAAARRIRRLQPATLVQEGISHGGWGREGAIGLWANGSGTKDLAHRAEAFKARRAQEETKPLRIHALMQGVHGTDKSQGFPSL